MMGDLGAAGPGTVDLSETREPRSEADERRGVGWDALIRREEGRARRYGGNPAVIMLEFDEGEGKPDHPSVVTRALAVVAGSVRDSDFAVRVDDRHVGVLVTDGGFDIGYVTARLRVLLSLGGLRPRAVRARTRAGHGDLIAAWRAALGDEPTVSVAGSDSHQHAAMLRVRTSGFLEGFISEMRLEQTLMTGVGQRLAGDPRPEMTELGSFLRQHHDHVEALLYALEMAAGRAADRPQALVDPADLVRVGLARRGFELPGDLRWAAPVAADPVGLHHGLEALFDAVTPNGGPLGATVSGSGLTLEFDVTPEILHDTRRSWRLRLARRFLEHDRGRVRVRKGPEGLRVVVRFPARSAS